MSCGEQFPRDQTERLNRSVNFRLPITEHKWFYKTHYNFFGAPALPRCRPSLNELLIMSRINERAWLELMRRSRGAAGQTRTGAIIFFIPPEFQTSERSRCLTAHQTAARTLFCTSASKHTLSIYNPLRCCLDLSLCVDVWGVHALCPPSLSDLSTRSEAQIVLEWIM